MSFDDELDLMNADCQAQLADCTITVMQNRPAGALDPATETRTVDASAQSFSASAVRDQDIVLDVEGRGQVRRRVWLIAADAATFRPSRASTVVDDDGSVRWQVVAVVDEIDGRQYRITGERTA